MGGCQSTDAYTCPPHHPRVPPTPTIVTELCKQKAKYIAHHSVHAAGNIRVAMAMLVFVAAAVLVRVAWDRSQSKRVGVGPATFGVFPLGFIALGMITYIYAVQHEFYCEAHPKWEHWNREWVVAGLLPGLLATFGLADWLYLAVRGVVGSESSPRGDSRGKPFSLYLACGIIGIPIGIAALALGTAYLILSAVKHLWCLSSWVAARCKRPSLVKYHLQRFGDTRDIETGVVRGHGSSHQAAQSASGTSAAARPRTGNGEEHDGAAVVELEMFSDDDAEIARPERTHAAAFPHHESEDAPPPYTPSPPYTS